jgi:hypothetical protein
VYMIGLRCAETRPSPSSEAPSNVYISVAYMVILRSTAIIPGTPDPELGVLPMLVPWFQISSARLHLLTP